MSAPISRAACRASPWRQGAIARRFHSVCVVLLVILLGTISLLLLLIGHQQQRA
jgi:hypothetical protein